VLVSGKVVLITGASRGIGAACAQAFGIRGALLSLTARTGCEFPEALVTPGDLTDRATRASVVERTLERYGRIDILVNNAGAGTYGPSPQANDDATRRMFELNFFAPLALGQLVVPHMCARGSGTIVNVASIAGKVTLPWMTLYSASKGALISLTDGLRRELRGTGVHAMTVCPGYVKTEFHGHAVGAPPPKLVDFMKYAITPEQCAEAIVRGVERDARTVVTPWWGRPFIALERIMPSVVDSRLSRVGL
jgi:short-subunit dehydrogenase